MKNESTLKNEKKAKTVERTLWTWAVGLILVILGISIRGDHSVSVHELSSVTFLLLVCSVILHSVRKYMEKRDHHPGMLARKELEA